MKLNIKKTLPGFLIVTAICISSASCANDDEANAATDVEAMAHGEEAHDNHCYKCHTDEVYQREDRFVKSIDALSKQVIRCKDSNDVPWFDEDADAVVQFLNKKYYKF